MYEKVKSALADYPEYFEKVNPKWFAGLPHIFLCGAGHVARAICNQAVATDFQVTVFDSHNESLDPASFPNGVKLICDQAENIKQYLPDEFFGVVAMGHDGNMMECLRQLLRAKPLYIGNLSSKRFAAGFSKKLIDEGFPEDDVNGIYSPVGLPIHAITPNEIGVSVIAEIISVKNSQKGVAVVSQELLDCREPGCLCMIVEQTEHVPRGVGSLMYVTKDRIYDSVGGSDAERSAIQKARECDVPFIEEYRSGHGSVKILYVPLWK